MSPTRYVRKQVFVSSRIQGRLVLRIAVYWIVYHVALWHALFAFRYIESRFSGDLVGQSFRGLYREFFDQYYPILICSLLMLPMFLFDLVKLSHRIAGPLVQFRHRIADMVAGKEVRRVRLRDGDLLDEFETAFNAYVDVYELQRQQQVAQAKMAERDAELIERTVRPQEASAASDPARDVAVVG
jgi:hypothetical protein